MDAKILLCNVKMRSGGLRLDPLTRGFALDPSTCMGMTLNCIQIIIVTGSFLYLCVMRPASQRFFIHSCIYLRIFIISYLATFLGTNSRSVLMCRKAVNQSLPWTPLGGTPPDPPIDSRYHARHDTMIGSLALLACYAALAMPWL